MGNPHLSHTGSVPGPVLLNRRAATRLTITGVERFTGEIIPRLHALAPERYAVVAPGPRLRGRARAQAWEQLILPVQAAWRGASVLFSPANLAPLAWPRNVIVVHDAAVLRQPEAYSAAYRAWHGRLGVAAARRALGVITVSEFSRRELIETAGLDPERLTVISPGVSDRFTPEADVGPVAPKLGLSRPYVLTVATSDRRKNLAALSAAAERLNQLGIELVHAGEGRPQFLSDGPPSALRSLGYVAETDLPGLYAGARAFVLPSRYEGFGLTCLEAMASGTPVVASDRGALAETCADAALLVKPDDQRAIAEAVVAAATDTGLRDRLREAGLRRARQFRWERATRETHALLMALATAARP